MERKNRYFAKISDEDKKFIDNKINSRLNNENQEEQFYGNELYITSEEFRDRFRKFDKQKNSTKIRDVQKNNYKDDNSDTNKDVIYMKEKDTGNKVLYDREEDIYRLRSFSSDQNEFILDRIKLVSLFEMGIISEEQLSSAMKSPDSAIEVLNNLRQLSQKEVRIYEDSVADKMLHDQRLIEIIPPKLLAQIYDKKQQYISEVLKKDVNADVKKEKSDIAKLEARIDSLIMQAAIKDGLFFTDVTNIADTYEGYNVMFKTREKYLSNDEKSENIKQNINIVRSQILEPMITDYDSEWNISAITKKDAQRLSRNFDVLRKEVSDIELNNETLQIVSNFKFLDEKEQVEPQFVDEQGNLHDNWEKGYKIAKNSKLETIVNLTKQTYIAQNLTNEQRSDKSQLQNEISEMFQNTLYAFYVADKTCHGALENKDQFKNKKYLYNFLVSLQDPKNPIKISNEGFDAAIDGFVNNTAGLANRVAQKVGRDEEIPMKIIDGISSYDKRANDRTQNGKMSKRNIRKEMFKRTIKSGLSAFMVSGAITTVSTIAASDASITAATMGMNKMAGAALGTGLAAVMITRNIIRWRKGRKKAGQKAGLKQLIKEPNLLSSITTTAMGAAAVGFAAAGNPGIAAALGYGSLTIGVATSIINNYKDSKKSGLSKLESLGWGALQAAVTVAAGFGGRAAANSAIDYINHTNPDNNIFQHEEKVGEHLEKDGTEIVVDYSKIDQNAEQFLQNNWYKDHPELLQQRINTLQTAGIENPYHTLLIAHDSGMIAPDNMQMWDGSTSHGNHTVLTQAWANENGVDFKDVQAMKNLFASDGSVNTDAVNAYKNLAQHVGEDNFVSRIEDRPVIKELYGERESTYDHDPKIPTKEIDHYKKVDDYEMVRNETDLGVGMFGVLGHKIGIRTIKERIGALLDRMAKNKKTYIESTPDKNVTKYSDGNTVDKDVTKHSDGKTVDKDVTKHSDGNTIDKDVTKHSDVNTVVKIRNSNSH